MNTDARLTAKLLSACPPDSAQKEKLEDVLSKKYGKVVELVWQEDRTAQGGFRIELGSEVIDWTAEGRLEQLKERLTGLKSEGSVIPLIRDAVKSWVPEVCAREVGSVLTVADGIAYVEGLEGATYGEILLFEGGAWCRSCAPAVSAASCSAAWRRSARARRCTAPERPPVSACPTV